MTLRLFCFLLITFWGLNPLLSGAASTNPPKQTLIVLDASGSMWGQIRGQAKIEIAREVIADLVQRLPDDAEIGLIAYGHRKKGDCDDIELLVPVGKLDRAAFLKQVNGLMPKGMTPLTAAVEFAAKTLAYTEQAATVVLVTDGEETCHRDPCEAAKALKAAGVDFKTHVIAFDLDSKAAKSVECMAQSTGGMFLKADDAASLSDALQMTLETEVKEAKPEQEVKEEPAGEAELKAPNEVVAGSRFEVEWTGPGEKGDYVAIVPEGAPEGGSRNYTYTRHGSPLKMTALIEAGAAELRYIQARPGKVIGRRPIKIIPAEVQLKAASGATAGNAVSVEWTGPNNENDFITIVPKSLEDGKYARYTYTRTGSPLKVEAPMEAGECEIRYQSGQGNKVLARVDLKVVDAEVSLKAPTEAVAGAAVSIEWTGPSNHNDFITIVPKSLEDGKYAKYTYTRIGNPLKVEAPMEAGECEIRYQSGQGNKVLARIDLKVTKAEVSLKAPTEAVAGAAVSIEWTGPSNHNDFITIVPKSLEDGKYANYTYTRLGSPLKVEAPMEAGECEIRYQSGQGNKVLARVDLKVTKAEVSLKAPTEAVAGAAVSIEWTGPNNKNDFITIVPKSLEDGKYANYTYTRLGNPLKVEAPMEAGECEIRYQSGQGNKVLERIDLKVTKAEVSLKAPTEVVAGAAVSIEWTGPSNHNDFITIVPKSFEDGKYARYTYTRTGNPLKVKAPMEAGECEIRYQSGQGNKVLERINLKVVEPEGQH